MDVVSDAGMAVLLALLGTLLFDVATWLGGP